MNERDSETVSGLLSEMGLRETGERNEADVVIINTCSVRENADNRFFGTLGQLKKIKEARPDFIVGVCGCMMQQRHITDALKEKYPWVDIIFGTHNIHELPGLMESVVSEKQKRMEVFDDAWEIVEGLPAKRLYGFKAFVNIMYGCNNFCTYCIVPYTRGREKSRSPESILDEVRPCFLYFFQLPKGAEKSVVGVFPYAARIYDDNVRLVSHAGFTQPHPGKNPGNGLRIAFVHLTPESGYVVGFVCDVFQIIKTPNWLFEFHSGDRGFFVQIGF